MKTNSNMIITSKGVPTDYFNMPQYVMRQGVLINISDNNKRIFSSKKKKK